MPSLTHRLLTLVIPRLRGASEVDDPDTVRREVLASQAAASTALPRRLPRRLPRSMDVSSVDDVGFPVWDLRTAGSTPTRTVLYLHGGGFVGGIDRFHWHFTTALARSTGTRFVLPAYPLTPEHTWRDSHPPLVDLFERLAIESPGGVTLMGDSAGGGLALALAQQIARRPGPQPTQLVLVSPWVDLTASTPGSEEQRAHDPWLTMTKLRLYGSWWAGDDDPDRPEVSPVHGDFTGLPPTLVMCGTRDLLLPQVREMVRRAAAAGVHVTYREERGLLHVYPILPIPEARRARRDIVDFLR